MSVRAILGGLLVVAALAGCGVSGAPAPGVGAERECALVQVVTARGHRSCAVEHAARERAGRGPVAAPLLHQAAGGDDYDAYGVERGVVQAGMDGQTGDEQPVWGE